MQVTGNLLVEAAPLFCRFGSTHAPTYVKSHSEILCVAPSSTYTGRAAFALVSGGSMGSPPLMGSFDYEHALQLITLLPTRGPSEGGARLTLNGRHFSRRAAELGILRVKFNATSVLLSEYISSTEVSCISPLHAPGAAVVEATNNVQQFTASGLDYLFVSVCLRGASPATGPVRGGTLVYLTVSDGIHAHDRLLCMFGKHATVAASFAGSTLFRCLSPWSDEAGVVGITVSDAMAHFPSSVQFSYESEPRVDTAYPAIGPQV